MWHLWSYLDEGKHMSSTTQWHNNRIKTHMLGGATPLRKIKGWWEDCVVGEGTRTDLHRSTLRGVEIRYTKRKGSWKFRRKELCTFMKLTKTKDYLSHLTMQYDIACSPHYTDLLVTFCKYQEKYLWKHKDNFPQTSSTCRTVTYS